ncbi:FtsX-like permease family protein [Flavipsychrobacter stenotrophus]|nr:FtsX-like permease family protein [Flavipsychrobacter stenotrophus]
MNRSMIWTIAARYFRGKGTANAVPLLSRISMAAIAVCSAAMIVVFSVFNGFDAFVKDNHKAFCPDIKISIVRGKFFPASAIGLDEIKKINGVLFVSPVIEDNALAGDGDEMTGSSKQQKVVIVKGVENSYFKVNRLGDYIIEGVDSVSGGAMNTAILGVSVADALRSGVENSFNYVQLYYANPEIANPETDPLNALQSLKVHPAGIFNVDEEFDDKYVIAPLAQVQELLHAQGKYSSIEIKADSTKIGDIKKTLQQKLGNTYKVEDIADQNKNLYAMMGGEKWIIYMILLFVLLIASFNMVGALSMLVVGKQKDIAILRAMGATPGLIRTVFLLEGVLWSSAGGIIGIALGCTVCFLQQHFELIKLRGSFLMSAFPVKLVFSDSLLVIVTIMGIGFLAAWYPAIRAGNSSSLNLKSD